MLQIGLMVAAPLAELRTPGREAIAVCQALMTRDIGRGDAQARIEAIVCPSLSFLSNAWIEPPHLRKWQMTRASFEIEDM
jgi:hypothetical protein